MSPKSSPQAKRRSLFIKLAFVILVIIGGTLLASSGNLSNPFTVFSTLASGNLAEGGEGHERGTPPEGSQAPSDTSTPGAQFQGGARGSSSEIALDWSAFAGVLFNLWFIAAAAAVIMVIGTPIGLGIKKLKSTRKRPPQLSPA